MTHSELLSLFAEEGISTVGVVGLPERESAGGRDARATAERRYHRWLEAGMHGSMAYLERHAPMKYRPEQILPGCRSVIVAAFPYAGQGSTPPAPHTHRIARYALHRDYHRAFGNRLRRIARKLARIFPGERFRAFTDTAPLDERYFAEQAGVGFVGRNGLLINSAIGTRLVIGEILSTTPFAPTPAEPGAHGACPTGCFACGRACPTGALAAPGKMDARKCISYLTIEYRSMIDTALRPRMGPWLFGCDHCQDACPFNAAPLPSAPEPKQLPAAPDLAKLELEDILSLESDAAFNEVFAGTAIRRTGRPAIVRNACIVAGNLRRSDLAPRISELRKSPESVIAAHAEWVYNQLHGHGDPLFRGY